VTDQTSREQPRQQWQEEQLSREELEFRRHWRLMIDRLGGQKQAAETMDWSTSTVSRDCQGITLPSSNRLRELSNYLELTTDARTELEVLLRRAREAQQIRRRDETASPQEASLPLADASSGELARQLGGRRPHRRWVIAVAIAVSVVVAAVIAGVFVVSPGKNLPAASPAMSTNAGVQRSYLGKGAKPVSIPMSSLTPSLRATFDQGRTKTAKAVTGYEFRNALNPSLCLTAADTGALAGQDKDPVEIAACRPAANQIWIPEQWDINGQSYTHLVSDKYQAKCLNAQKIGGTTGPGNAIFLYRCYYPAGNEAWAFETWYQNVAPGHQSYPLCLSNADRYCIDTDKRPGVSASVHLWTHQAIAGQFWS
jgi:hypothetical protein